MSVEVTGLNLNVTANSGADIGKTAKDLSELSKALKGFTINKNKVESLRQLGLAANAFALAVNKMDTAKINGFASAVGSLSSIKVSKSLANGVNDLVASFDKLDFRKLHGQADSLNRTLEPLAKTLQTIATASKGINLSAALGKGAARASDALSKEQEKLGGGKEKVNAPEINETTRSYMSLGQAIGAVNKKLSESSFGKLFDGIKSGVKQTIAFVEKLGHAFVSALKFSARLGAGLGKVLAVSSRIGFLNPFRGFANSVQNVTKRIGTLWSSLKRIAFYRAIRTAIKEVTQGLREGLENLYNWSKATGGDFAPAMDKMATAALYVKNSLGAMVSPILTAVAPAVDYLADRFVELLNIVNQVLAKLTGRATWTAALKYPTEFGDKVGGAAKKLKDNIQDFDELHILRTPSDGGGSAAEDYSKMFEEREYENELYNWIEDFKLAIKNGDWSGAGKILGDEINSLVDRVNWNDVGKRLAGKINDAFSFSYSFLKTTDFKKIGTGFADFVNGVVEDLDTNKIGKTFARKWTMIVDFMYGFVTTFDFSNFGTAVSDFVQGWFEEIDGDKIGKTFGEAIKGIFKAGTAFLSNDSARKEFINDINGFFNGIDWNGINIESQNFASTLTEWFKKSMAELDTAAIGQTIGNAIHTALDMAIVFIDEGGLDALVDGLIDIINNIDWYDALIKGLYIGAKIVGAIFDVIIGAFTGDYKHSNSLGAATVKAVDNSYDAWKASSMDGVTRFKQVETGSVGEAVVGSITSSVSGADTSKLRDAFKIMLEKAWGAAIKVAEFIVDPIAEKASEAYLTIVEGIDLEGNDVSDIFGETWFNRINGFLADQSEQLSSKAILNAGKTSNPILKTILMQTGLRLGALSGVQEYLKTSVTDQYGNFHPQGWGSDAFGGAGGRFQVGRSEAYYRNKDYITLVASTKKVKQNVDNATKSMLSFGKKSKEEVTETADAWTELGEVANSDAVNGVSSASAKITSLVGSLTSDTSNKFQTMGSNIVNSISNTSKNIATPLNSVKSQIDGTYNGATENAKTKMNGLATAVVTSLTNTSKNIVSPLNTVKSQIGSAYGDAKTTATSKMNELNTAVVTSIKNTFTNIAEPLKNVKTQITNTYAEAGTAAVNSMNDFAPKLQSALSTVSSATTGGLNAISGIWGSFRDSVKISANGTIAAAEGVANGVIEAFNSLKNSVNNVINGINSAMGALSGKQVNTINTVTLPKISLPRLATGGIVGSPTTALIGEAGREAILPLDNNTGWMDTLAMRINGDNIEETELLREQNDLLRQLVAKKTGITEREIYDAVRNQNQERFVRTGENALVM